MVIKVKELPVVKKEVIQGLFWARHPKILEYFSRKFILSLVSLLGSFWLVWADKDIVDLIGVIAVTLGFYNGANVAQDYVNYKKDKMAAEYPSEESARQIDRSRERDEDG